ncbi:hypothetical protein EYF80_029012 [Liparis tanakae]|uniref:Uncharacterized protein n=1 Tax=Liparis tanakae TaxID=230148 RepID=A0A4Z2H4I6_9TELE|nr:hypothetical protein EYF80_029012 [Liparis tanakae]
MNGEGKRGGSCQNLEQKRTPRKTETNSEADGGVNATSNHEFTSRRLLSCLPESSHLLSCFRGRWLIYEDGK